MVDTSIPIAFNTNDMVVFDHNLHGTANRAAVADRFDFGQISIMHLISTGSVDDCTGRADLDTTTALDTGAFAERDIRVGNDHTLSTAFRHRKSKVARHFAA